jgi:hypothetical protein
VRRETRRHSDVTVIPERGGIKSKAPVETGALLSRRDAGSLRAALGLKERTVRQAWSSTA